MKLITQTEELLLLAVIRLRDRASLVSILDLLHKTTGEKWTVGNAFVALDRMHKAGLLECFTGEPTARRGGRAVKYYRPTEDGLAALAEIKKVQDALRRPLQAAVPEKS